MCKGIYVSIYVRVYMSVYMHTTGQQVDQLM